jgi:UDP-glucuronate decarboxylase
VTFLLESDIEEIFNKLDSRVGDAAPFWDLFSGKNVVITGGRGFLGRYFSAVFSLANKTFEKRGLEPCNLYVIDNGITSGKLGENVLEDEFIHYITADIVSKDLRSYEVLKNLRVDYFISAAGIASPYYYRKYPVETLSVATIGLKNCIEYALESNPTCRFTFFSSSEIYGDPDSKHVPTPESYRGNVSCLGPRSCYDESKRLGETIIRVYHETRGLAGTIIRPFNVYGPGMQKLDYRVLPNFASRISDGLPLKVYGKGDQTRTFCYITDAMVGFLLTLVYGTPGEPYNIGNSSPEISMVDLVNTVKSIVSSKVEYDTVEYPDSYPADEPNRRCPDLTKAYLHLSYFPDVSLVDGLFRFFRWADVEYRK